MTLWIDGQRTETVAGESVLDAVRRLGLITRSCPGVLWQHGLQGETFTLNYVP